MEGLLRREVVSDVAVVVAGTGDKESVNFPKTRNNRGMAQPPIMEIIEEKISRIFSGVVAREKNLRKEIGGGAFMEEINKY